MTAAPRDVVVTGVGLVTALGEGRAAHREALYAPGGPRPVVDEAAFAPFPVHPLPPLDLDRQIPKRGDQRQMEPWQRLGTYAAGLALDDAGARNLVADMHLIVAAGGGERDIALDEAVAAELARSNDPGARLNAMLSEGLRPTLFLAQLSNLVAGNVSIVHGVTGSSRTFMGEEAAAADALRVARARIAERRGDAALVGGCFTARWDTLLLHRGGGGLMEGSYRPLSERRGPGLVLGSMAAFLVLEAAPAAAARGAAPLARLDAVATDASRRDRRPGASAEAARALLEHVGGPAGAVISGMSGAPDARREEEAFLAEAFPPGTAAIRRPAALIGHGVEAAFFAYVALAALALAEGGPFYPPMDPADVGEAHAPSRVLVTGFAGRRGEALAALSRAEA